ncbi:MAG: M20/M25/M40 family metallo-hydrolase [Elusimicrobiaceae bacterium]|nr:M20/M25/M40 family metallo-hydrolase [Elusimicrobiaceae bacterium]
MINEKRLLDNFLKLVQIDSESFNEAKIHKVLVEELKKLGCIVYVDKAGKKFNTNAAGNIIATLKGKGKGKPFILSAHMDTVCPGVGVKPCVKKDRVTSDGTTILGADDKAGIAIILETLRVLKELKGNHPSVQVIFTLCEEVGITGAKYLDYSKIKGKDGLILDNESSEELIVRGPGKYNFNVTIHGVTAHAGVCPEKGISALDVLGKAMRLMKHGRVDKETVCNFGVISGGRITNAVLSELTLKGEVRSLNAKKLEKQIKHMKDCFAKAEKAFVKKVDGKTIQPKIEIETELSYGAQNISKTSTSVKLTITAARKHGVNLKAVVCGGGCDANVMAQHGLALPNLGIGVEKCHSLDEYLSLPDFYRAARIVVDTVLSYRG